MYGHLFHFWIYLSKKRMKNRLKLDMNSTKYQNIDDFAHLQFSLFLKYNN